MVSLSRCLGCNSHVAIVSALALVCLPVLGTTPPTALQTYPETIPDLEDLQSRHRKGEDGAITHKQAGMAVTGTVLLVTDALLLFN